MRGKRDIFLSPGFSFLALFFFSFFFLDAHVFYITAKLTVLQLRATSAFLKQGNRKYVIVIDNLCYPATCTNFGNYIALPSRLTTSASLVGSELTNLLTLRTEMRSPKRAF